MSWLSYGEEAKCDASPLSALQSVKVNMLTVGFGALHLVKTYISFKKKQTDKLLRVVGNLSK